eukprot:TRINITY_DN404_c3_g1_i1.p1 TRINITY_DN404_c3_g1~~TRINITY_DN404_c3_g1_i1.p1  ORF type:complete len:901 (+),score=236.34 TRINITY_DN404_c3_g1_i1:79-2781(+)
MQALVTGEHLWGAGPAPAREATEQPRSAPGPSPRRVASQRRALTPAPPAPRDSIEGARQPARRPCSVGPAHAGWVARSPRREAAGDGDSSDWSSDEAPAPRPPACRGQSGAVASANARACGLSRTPVPPAPGRPRSVDLPARPATALAAPSSRAPPPQPHYAVTVPRPGCAAPAPVSPSGACRGWERPETDPLRSIEVMEHALRATAAGAAKAAEAVTPQHRPAQRHRSRDSLGTAQITALVRELNAARQEAAAAAAAAAEPRSPGKGPAFTPSAHPAQHPQLPPDEEEATVPELVAACKVRAALDRCRSSRAERAALQLRVAAARRTRPLRRGVEIVRRNAATQGERTQERVQSARRWRLALGRERYLSAKQRAQQVLAVKRERAAALSCRADILRELRRRQEKAEAVIAAVILCPLVLTRLGYWREQLLAGRQQRAEAARWLALKTRAHNYVSSCRLRWGMAKLRRCMPAILLAGWLSRRMLRRRQAVLLIRVFFSDLRAAEVVPAAVCVFHNKVRHIQRFVRAHVHTQALRLAAYALQWEAAERQLRWGVLLREALQPRPKAKRKHRAAVSTKQMLAATPFTFARPIPWRLRLLYLRGALREQSAEHSARREQWQLQEQQYREELAAASAAAAAASPRSQGPLVAPPGEGPRQRRLTQPPAPGRAPSAAGLLAAPAAGVRRVRSVSMQAWQTRPAPAPEPAPSGPLPHGGMPVWSIWLPPAALHRLLLAAAAEYQREIAALSEAAAAQSAATGDLSVYTYRRDARLEQYWAKDAAVQLQFERLLHAASAGGASHLAARWAADDGALRRLAEEHAAALLKAPEGNLPPPPELAELGQVSGVPPAAVPHPGNDLRRLSGLLAQHPATRRGKGSGRGKSKSGAANSKVASPRARQSSRKK